MTDNKIAELAKFAAETMNGGQYDDKKYYNHDHRRAWENMVQKLLEKANQ